jgi:uncharacterized membrane protein YbhN (UPF0104 family)
MSLFFIAVIYSVDKAPDIIWDLDLSWLALVILFVILMFAAEISQFHIFLRQHKIKPDLLIPIWFTTRKSILNSLLPAKSGTLLFLHLIIRHYNLRWHEYITYMITATVMMLIVSGTAFLGLFLSPIPFYLFVVLLFLGSWFVGRTIQWGYLEQTVPLLLVSIGIYMCRVLIFWALLRSAGDHVGFIEASYFAIATNTLAQVSITPGNIGVREVILGMISPYLSLPISLGVIVGAIFQVLRIVVYGLILLIVDVFFRNRFSDLAAEPEVPGQA